MRTLFSLILLGSALIVEQLCCVVWSMQGFVGGHNYILYVSRKKCEFYQDVVTCTEGIPYM